MMSLELKETRLPGFEGPFCVDLQTTLRFASALWQWDMAVLVALTGRCRQIRGFDRWGPITTDDDYQWLCGLYFHYGWPRRRTVVIAVPHSSDRQLKDGTPLDRRPVMYFVGGASIQDGLRAMNAVTAVLCQH